MALAPLGWITPLTRQRETAAKKSTKQISSQQTESSKICGEGSTGSNCVLSKKKLRVGQPLSLVACSTESGQVRASAMIGISVAPPIECLTSTNGEKQGPKRGRRARLNGREERKDKGDKPTWYWVDQVEASNGFRAKSPAVIGNTDGEAPERGWLAYFAKMKMEKPYASRKGESMFTHDLCAILGMKQGAAKIQKKLGGWMMVLHLAGKLLSG
ncbi:hypothetical protein K438DRAFT_1779540 [Mycena galopus ATCC 62051]|nr:hypothetical protein K438DRAFT_1783558 [Mycena galopus ATCC 62051]KAF8148761.1 hypothetical protein K438DRAFT_1779540 [Mycena galopus ATCC 62051]